MKKSQIIAIVIGVAAIAILFSLPRVVVDNDEGGAQITESEESNTSNPADMHLGTVDESMAAEIASLRGQMEAEDNQENFATFADAIAELYLEAGKFDSAAYFYELAAEKINSLARLEKTGTAYYEAYTFALNEQKVAFLAEKTRSYLNQVLEKDPKRLDLKTKVAMTYVSSSNPMQGITMLREVLEAEPTNEDALFNMGVLSMQSGQYKRAADRFEELVKYHPNNLQGQFYLAVSYFESKQNNKAKKQFEQVKDMTTDPMVLSSVDSYLERL
ncbi:Tetratricopeptide repeat-containing protein [Belliella buryatensis]|uniref:Tetratricopeptide repeat-containing protein n=1 Tax=Belliella buryatensis TaxID=1500549 RepID=A0A239BST3_9BACT|nr:tetratricopeptide repeat protein [Belliella buryatensis]SNS10966.1 Tetratricopeptide repeat-containing protein [Belliella buryatensis]